MMQSGLQIGEVARHLAACEGESKSRSEEAVCPVFLGLTQIEPLTRGEKEGRE